MTFIYLFIDFLNIFLKQSILPNIMQSLALGLLTVTIAVAVFLAEKGSVFAFDKIVILKKVIHGKTFLLFLLALFLPIFLWEVGGVIEKFLLFVSYMAGVGGFFTFLLRSYKWIEEIETENKRTHNGYRQKLRLKYLEEISTSPQKQLAWEYIWQLKNKTSMEERVYINKFIKNIDSFINKDNDKSATEYTTALLNRFLENIDLRDWPVFEDIFVSVINWHKSVSMKYNQNEENKRRYIHLKITLERLISKLVESGLRLGVSYMLFKVIDDFIKNTINIEGDTEYLERFIGIFAPVFFDNIADSPEGYDIWDDYFPKEWKITKENIEDHDNKLPNLWLSNFLSWMQPRMWKHLGEEVDWDKKLDEVSTGLFPEVDPITWSIILTFLSRPYGDNRLRDLIENSRRFGFSSRVGPAMNIDDEEEIWTRLDARIESGENKAIELASILFGSQFTKEKLDSYISELIRLNYESNSRHDKYRNQIKNIFEKMLEKLSDNEMSDEE